VTVALTEDNLHAGELKHVGVRIDPVHDSAWPNPGVTPMTDSQTLKPTALTIPMLAQLLSRTFREPVTDAMIENDLQSGAPKNVDGTIHLVHYAAWLTQERLR
jgi:hypothetical protein